MHRVDTFSEEHHVVAVGARDFDVSILPLAVFKVAPTVPHITLADR